jgi:hypothetical protein
VNIGFTFSSNPSQFLTYYPIYLSSVLLFTTPNTNSPCLLHTSTYTLSLVHFSLLFHYKLQRKQKVGLNEGKNRDNMMSSTPRFIIQKILVVFTLDSSLTVAEPYRFAPQLFVKPVRFPRRVNHSLGSSHWVLHWHYVGLWSLKFQIMTYFFRAQLTVIELDSAKQNNKTVGDFFFFCFKGSVKLNCLVNIVILKLMLAQFYERNYWRFHFFFPVRGLALWFYDFFLLFNMYLKKKTYHSKDWFAVFSVSQTESLSIYL